MEKIFRKIANFINRKLENIIRSIYKLPINIILAVLSSFVPVQCCNEKFVCKNTIP